MVFKTITPFATRWCFTISILFFSTPLLIGQAMLDTLAQETCECVSQKNLEGLDEAALNMELGLCIMQGLNTHEGKLGDDLKVDIADQESMRKLGEQIGLRMANRCPDILMMIVSAKGQKANANNGTVLTGTIKAIDGEEFGRIILVDETGREHKLLWLRYFKGSDQLVADATLFIGKKARVEYETIECYLPKVKEYSNRKEVKSLEILD